MPKNTPKADEPDDLAFPRSSAEWDALYKEWDNEPVARFAHEMERVRDDPRTLVLVTSGWLELLVNTLIQVKCKNGERLAKGRDLATKLLILNEIGIIGDRYFQVLDQFRHVRNRAAHDPIFEFPQDFIEKERLNIAWNGGFASWCNLVVGILWNAHRDVFLPIFAPRFAAFDRAFPAKPTAVANGIEEPVADDLLRFFHLGGRLKETARAGWELRGIAEPESVADHSFRLALLALVLAPKADPSLDVRRCVAMALVHDLAECLVGDITPYDGVSEDEKRRREEEAMRRLDTLAGGAGLVDLWAEYDAAATPEARFVKELDKLETAMQAAEYARAGAASPDELREFRDSAERRVTLPVTRALLDALSREPDAGPPTDPE